MARYYNIFKNNQLSSKKGAWVTPKVPVLLVDAACRVAFFNDCLHQSHDIFLGKLALSIDIVLIKKLIEVEVILHFSLSIHNEHLISEILRFNLVQVA